MRNFWVDHGQKLIFNMNSIVIIYKSLPQGEFIDFTSFLSLHRPIFHSNNNICETMTHMQLYTNRLLNSNSHKILRNYENICKYTKKSLSGYCDLI